MRLGDKRHKCKFFAELNRGHPCTKSPTVLCDVPAAVFLTIIHWSIEEAVYRGYNPMVRVVWLNTSPRCRPRAVRPEGGVEGWCPAIPRGPLGCILLTTIMRGKGMFLWPVDKLAR